MRAAIASLFRHLSAGVYVIGVADREQRNAFTASSLMQVSYSPLLVALTVGAQHASYALLEHSRVFTINVLGEDQQALAAHFGTQSGRTVDKLASQQWRAGKTGAPLLQDALAYFECGVVDDYAAGDHRLVVACVLDGAVQNPAGSPLLYAQTGNLDGSETLFPDSFS